MTVQANLQCLPVNYPKPIMAKLLNNQSQSWEMMLSQHAMDQLITGLGNDAIKECNEANTPYKGACRSSENGDGRKVETSLVP